MDSELQTFTNIQRSFSILVLFSIVDMLITIFVAIFGLNLGGFMKELTIFGLLLTDRLCEASQVQEILTKYGCYIKTRLGLHEASEATCSKKGLILLELVGNSTEWKKMEEELSKINGLIIKKMEFEY